MSEITIADQPALAIYDLVARFVHPTDPAGKNLLIVDAYRGDFTESGERRLRAFVGEEAYKTIHHDTIACNDRVIVYLPRCVAPSAEPAPWGFRTLTAEHHWALNQVDEKGPEVTRARPETIQRVPVETARELYTLPGLEFVEVGDVHYWEHGNGAPKKKKKRAPQNVVYFRFTGGHGVVLPTAANGGAS